MKQVGRFFVKPNQFVNQLQWSKHHTWLLFAFLCIAGVEAHVGKSQGLYMAYADALAQTTGLNSDLAMWIVVTAKIGLVLGGAAIVALGTWFVGNFLGHSSSQRVLFRRFAVVFTLAMAAYTGNHLIGAFPWLETASFFLYFWAGLLGYFAIREQFGLTHVETAFVGVFTVFMVLTTWHYSNQVLENQAHAYVQTLAAKPSINVGAALGNKVR